MTEQEKKELLIALCGYLPYGVMVQVPELFHPEIKFDVELDGVTKYNDGFHFTDDYGYTIEHIKPYLRPMESMTEEEHKELGEKGIYVDDDFDICYEAYEGRNVSLKYVISEYIDWLYEHHLDYRGLIPKGLALPAPDGMYSTYKYFPPESYNYFPSEFKTYAEYVEYLKSKGLAFDAPNGK